MPEYDSENFDPPAPVASVTLQNPATGAALSDVPMLIDTGADVTLVLREALKRNGVGADEGSAYEVEGLSGDVKMLRAALLELHFLKKKFAGKFLISEEPIGILGHNILNALAITLDGPGGKWREG